MKILKNKMFFPRQLQFSIIIFFCLLFFNFLNLYFFLDIIFSYLLFGFLFMSELRKLNFSWRQVLWYFFFHCTMCWSSIYKRKKPLLIVNKNVLRCVKERNACPFCFSPHVLTFFSYFLSSKFSSTADICI